MGKVKIYKINSVEKSRTCNGCNRVINSGSSCLKINSSFKGWAYRNYFHNEDCLKKYNEIKRGDVISVSSQSRIS